MMTNTARNALVENPFLELLGIEIEHLADGEAICRLRAEEKHTRIGAFLHGGAVASLIDTAMAFAVANRTGSSANAVTVDLTIHYLRPVTTGEIIATARILRAGKRLLPSPPKSLTATENLWRRQFQPTARLTRNLKNKL